MIALIMVARLAVILGSTLFNNKNCVTDTLTEAIVMLVFERVKALNTLPHFDPFLNHKMCESCNLSLTMRNAFPY